MAIFQTTTKDYIRLDKESGYISLLKKEKFESFNEDILGLGRIESKSQQINAISVLFDLEGFTNFCKQIDPHLAVPEYLSEFLKWLFKQIRKELICETYPDGYDTYSDLPFLSKFMGDGVLFLWKTDNLSEKEIMNIVVSMLEICRNYKTFFLKEISKKIVSPPPKLRCGIARGVIYSVGNGNDFVGPCINMSARLQKLHSLTFAFSRRGLNPEHNESYSQDFITKMANIRGIGDRELVCVLRSEFNQLDKADMEKFANP